MCNLKGAHSREFKKSQKHAVIDLMPDQRNTQKTGGTMRLGAYPCIVQTGTRTYDAYGEIVISERHRHRYEVNNDYREDLTQHGMVFSGLSPDGRLVEMIELPRHPWFIAVQFHPELKSRAVRAHPRVRVFVAPAKARLMRLACHLRSIELYIANRRNLSIDFRANRPIERESSA